VAAHPAASSRTPGGRTSLLLPTPPGSDRSFAHLIDDIGAIAGGIDTGPWTESQAARWNPHGEVTSLGTLPGGTSSSAEAMNAVGTIVGSSTTGTGSFHAVLWPAAPH
jgi:uncharacterized membrane protein